MCWEGFAMDSFSSSMTLRIQEFFLAKTKPVLKIWKHVKQTSADKMMNSQKGTKLILSGYSIELVPDGTVKRQLNKQGQIVF